MEYKSSQHDSNPLTTCRFPTKSKPKAITSNKQNYKTNHNTFLIFFHNYVFFSLEEHYFTDTSS